MTTIATAASGIVFIGMETSGALRRRFQAAGFETYSADVLPSEDGGEEMVIGADGLPKGRHLVGDAFETLENLWANDLWPSLAIFHPTCTYLTNSCAWAFNDPDFDRYPGVGYHQRVKPGTLVGAARRAAREAALDDVRRICALPIRRKVIENPVGAINTRIRKPTQIIQPYEFGDDASKGTCLWMMGKDCEPMPEMRLPLDPALRVPGRMVCEDCRSTSPHAAKDAPCRYCSAPAGRKRERWGNQTDSGQNNLSPGDDRWKDRSRTFGGIADAMVRHWGPMA